MTKNSKILLAALGAAVAIGIGLYLLLGPMGEARTRRNVLASASYYLGKGDYDRALDLLDKLLISNASDPEAQALRDKAMSGKTGTEAAKAEETAKAEESGQKAIANSLAKLSQNLKSAPPAAAPAASAARPPAENPADAAAKAKKAEDEARRKAEADAEAARKKAEAEELAKKSRELQDRMRAVNELVDKGKAAIDRGDFQGGEKLFGDAETSFPDGEDKYAGQKLAEIADSLYSAAKKNPGQPADAALQESIQTARDAKKKDANNAMPYYTLGKINADLKQTDNAITELKQANSLDPKNYLYAYELGKAYFAARRYEDARQAFDATVTLNPKFESAF
ncbi:MAG TPA: tetratricopeptide repeat protein, partial [Rectinemataceae bacterium]|nr:tetratricopeptide repeat protein [Rectinemataceae bacterium]